jgi:hypothetical protein
VDCRRRRLLAWSFLALALCAFLVLSATGHAGAAGALLLPALLIDLLWLPILIWAARGPEQPVLTTSPVRGTRVCRAPPF